MKLFIVRHGEAAFDAKSDRLRPLTERGRMECERQVLDRQSQLAGIEHIWVSELLRANQTADIFSKHLSVPVESKRFLAPESDPARVVRELEQWNPAASLLLVSHQPLVGCLVSLLCNGHVYEAHPFATAELVCLDFEVFGAGLGVLGANWRV